MNKQLRYLLIIGTLLCNMPCAFSMQRLGAIWGQLTGKKAPAKPVVQDTAENFLPITPEKFTLKNIQKFPQFKQEFITYALGRFDVPSIYRWEADIIELLIRLYPDQVKKFTQKVLRDCVEIHSNILVTVMIYDPESIVPIAQQFISALSIPNTTTIKMNGSSIEIHTRDMFFKLLEEFQKRWGWLPNGLYTSKENPEDQKKRLDTYVQFKVAIKKLVFDSPYTIPINQLDIIYEQILNQEEQIVLKDLLLKRFKKATSANMLQGIPKFMAQDICHKGIDSTQSTQTKQHLFACLKQGVFVHKQIKNIDEKARQFFLKIYAQEKLEHADGNYVFYHGRQWLWNFVSDVYKQLWNITHNQQVGENFQFLRFGTGGPNREDNRDILFMNSALFGNMTHYGSCSAYYWLANTDQSVYRKEMVPAIQNFFVKFGLKSLYDKHMEKYDKYIAQLEALHKKASSGRGEFLLISIPAYKLNQVISTRSGGAIHQVTIQDRLWNRTDGTSNTKVILDTIKSNPEAIQYLDNLEWGLMLGTFGKDNSYMPAAYANDPYNGPTIYSFHDADEKVMAVYEKLRDEFFAQIKKDLELEKSSKSKIAQPSHEAPAGTASQIKSKL